MPPNMLAKNIDSSSDTTEDSSSAPSNNTIESVIQQFTQLRLDILQVQVHHLQNKFAEATSSHVVLHGLTASNIQSFAEQRRELLLANLAAMQQQLDAMMPTVEYLKQAMVAQLPRETWRSTSAEQQERPNRSQQQQQQQQRELNDEKVEQESQGQYVDQGAQRHLALTMQQIMQVVQSQQDHLEQQRQQEHPEQQRQQEHPEHQQQQGCFEQQQQQQQQQQEKLTPSRSTFSQTQWMHDRIECVKNALFDLDQAGLEDCSKKPSLPEDLVDVDADVAQIWCLVSSVSFYRIGLIKQITTLQEEVERQRVYQRDLVRQVYDNDDSPFRQQIRSRIERIKHAMVEFKRQKQQGAESPSLPLDRSTIDADVLVEYSESLQAATGSQAHFKMFYELQLRLAKLIDRLRRQDNEELRTLVKFRLDVI
ncbi:hypothetical protein EDD11_008433 [Mortierella claussenii]|nr:hypothetical protein EDD11_008433 [Mortierella claussenii]